MTQRAKAFKETRRDHENELAEDYVEVILELIARNGEARVGTIAKEIGVSHVTTLRALKRLESRNFVIYKDRYPIGLTKKGIELAKRTANKHKLVLSLLRTLGVPTRQAEIDAEGIEHHISPITLKCIERFVAKKSCDK